MAFVPHHSERIQAGCGHDEIEQPVVAFVRRAAIVESKHPVTALLQFIEHLDQLDDERWMALETTITESFGKPLFVAASRGKLAIAAEAKPAVSREKVEKLSDQ